MNDSKSSNNVELQETLQRLQREKGEADGMLRILTSKLHEVEEDNFDLRFSMSLFETETKYESEKKVSEMQKRLAALESNLAFMSEKLQNAERGKLRAIKEMEQLQQKHNIEAKRRDAEHRLMATRRRKHESLQIASQANRVSQNQSQFPQPGTKSSPVLAVEASVQTESRLGVENCKDGNLGLREENARLLSQLLTGTSRSLLTLLNGASTKNNGISEVNSDDQTQLPHEHHSISPSQFHNDSSSHSLDDSLQQSVYDDSFSQNVFSQFAGKATAQAQASMLSAAMKSNATQNALAIDQAQALYDVMGKMLAGDVSAIALVPVFINYLTAATPLSAVCSVLHVMYSLMHNSNRDYLSARIDNETVLSSNLLQLSTSEAASEQRQLRLTLMTALCEAVKNNLNEPTVVQAGLCVLCYWIDLGLAHRTPEFKHLLSSNLISSILMVPQNLYTHKAQAIRLFFQLLRDPESFVEVKNEAKKSLLFYRCAKMLVHSKNNILGDEAKSLRVLQHQIVQLLLLIVTSFPAEGIRFVLESTHGPPADGSKNQSIIYCLVQLLDRETFVARSTSATQELLSDQKRMILIRDSFALLGLLSHYVDVRRELGGDDQVHIFLSILYFLSTFNSDNGDNDNRSDSIVATARALITMVNFSTQ
ncbi:uncharacterized protein PHALS_06654 [Plasmopara halstedii]|uniref:Uncharacterized protein n=1 Tax=Plasmopara halstedii TaxID=4781 RepID=A0A0P1B2D0_PLAHL|nr:uncharacterized protein PHALS_06654 [Plasmopara halstedii]CEG48857.1 hypothetical protein PHALS_06654 [Plasmopara halstedii]|eukprot:XP_024585226.1 hypothetical protein PHALS_06654 [Plasmopara halstedii]